LVEQLFGRYVCTICGCDNDNSPAEDFCEMCDVDLPDRTDKQSAGALRVGALEKY